jgi:nucleoid-associated protein YgaU
MALSGRISADRRETLDMPNDAKLGMIVGVGLVIAIAVVFFRKDGVLNQPGADQAAATAATSANPAPTPGYRAVSGPVPARTAIRTGSVAAQGQRRHTVVEGETLFSLAQHYYHDEKKFVDIYRVNQEVVQTPDRLAPGTVLVIPDLP